MPEIKHENGCRALNFSRREVWKRRGPQQREPPLWCIPHGQVQTASKALASQTSISSHSVCLQPSMWSSATNFKCQPAPLNKHVPVHWHYVLNTHSMPMLSNKASHKLECSGRFSSPFYPFGRQCDFHSKGFIFAAQAAGLPQKHSPPQFMTSDACRSKMVHHTGHGHVVCAALPNTEAHALHTWRMLWATKHAEDAGCERPTHPSVWVLASKSSGKHNDLGTKHREQWLFRRKQATFRIEENNFQ